MNCRGAWGLASDRMARDDAIHAAIQCKHRIEIESRRTRSFIRAPRSYTGKNMQKANNNKRDYAKYNNNDDEKYKINTKSQLREIAIVGISLAAVAAYVCLHDCRMYEVAPIKYCIHMPLFGIS